MSRRCSVSTRCTSAAIGSPTSAGHASRMMSVASSASEPVPKKLASEVTRIRNGNSDKRIESAMWLAIAHPSCRRKRPEAIFATARRVLKRGTRLRCRKGGGEARRPSELPSSSAGYQIHTGRLLAPPSPRSAKPSGGEGDGWGGGGGGGGGGGVAGRGARATRMTRRLRQGSHRQPRLMVEEAPPHPARASPEP